MRERNTAASHSSSAVQGHEDNAKRKKGGASSHWTMLVLFLSLLLDLLGFTVILPLIPSLLEYYGRGDQVHEYIYTLHAVFVCNVTCAPFHFYHLRVACMLH